MLGFQMGSPRPGWLAAIREAAAVVCRTAELEETSADQLVQLPWLCLVGFGICARVET